MKGISGVSLYAYLQKVKKDVEKQDNVFCLAWD